LGDGLRGRCGGCHARLAAVISGRLWRRPPTPHPRVRAFAVPATPSRLATGCSSDSVAPSCLLWRATKASEKAVAFRVLPFEVA
jgi:hypothetical protein